MNNLKTLNEKIKFYTPQLKRRRNKNAEESCDDFRCKDYTHTNLGNHLETLRVSVEKIFTMIRRTKSKGALELSKNLTKLKITLINKP